MIGMIERMTLTAVGICLLMSVPLAGSAARSEEKGLVAQWDFNEGKGDVLHDRSGNNNRGKIKGAAWVKSGKGFALKFDGKDDYVDCGNGKSLDITGPITLQVWVKPTAPNQGEPGIVGKFWQSYCMTYSTSAYFYISSGGNNVRGPLKMHEWTHVAGTFDGTTLRLYLNGEEAGSKKSKFKTIKHGKNFLIGCIIGDPASQDINLRNTAFFPGLIDDVRVHNRVLSHKEIARCYNLEAANKGLEPFDTTKFGRLLLEPFFYPDTDRAVLSVNSHWVLPLPEAVGVVVELAAAGSSKALQSKAINPNAPHNEDEAEFSLKDLKSGTYELRALVCRPDKIIQAEKFSSKSASVRAYTEGWMAGKVDLRGGWTEYDFETSAGEHQLSVLAARIHDSAGIRCTIDGKGTGEIDLNGPDSGGDTAWAHAKWQPFAVYPLTKGRHTLRVQIMPVHVAQKNKTYSRSVYIDAFTLTSVAAEAQEGRKIERVRFRYPLTRPAPLPSPAERRVAPLPQRVTPPSYDLELATGGGFTVRVKGRTYRIESSYSYPHGGYNRLVADQPDTEGERSWKVGTRKRDDNNWQVTASGKHYAISRTITREKSRILVKDTITNRSNDVGGIMLSNHINMHGLADARVTDRDNPTIFVGTKDSGVGLIALDDLYQLQMKSLEHDGLAKVFTEHFGLDKGASYTVEWAVYPTATSDYYDFINQVRWDEGINGYVEGTLGGMSRRKPLPAETVDRKNIAYARMGCLGKPPDDPAVSLEGFEFVEYPIESRLIKKTFAESKALYPNMRVMFHVAHSLYACSNPKERFLDSRALHADGTQVHYGPNTWAYHGKYFSRQRFDEGWRWWIFYPTMENSFGKAMIKGMEYMLDYMGATGMWADGYISGYVKGGYSYDRWDGHSVIIDPETKLVTRKVTCVPWVALPVLKKVVRMIEAKGGITFTNGHPGPRSMWKEAMITCCETGGGDARPLGGLHLGRTLTPLGNPHAIKNARDIYRDIIGKLDHGALYTWYGDREYMQRKTLIEHMYPITFDSIHAGTVRGKERIITRKSGIYGWHGDGSLHVVYLYDARGALTRNNFITTVDKSSVRTELTLKKDQSAAVVKLPVTLTSSAPVNLNVRQYDANGIRITMNGKGTVDIHMTNGAFPVDRNSAYIVTAAGKTHTIAARKKDLTFPVELDGPTDLTVQRQGKP